MCRDRQVQEVRDARGRGREGVDGRTRVWVVLAVDGNEGAVDVSVLKGLLAGGDVVGFDRGTSAAPARVVEDLKPRFGHNNAESTPISAKYRAF